MCAFFIHKTTNSISEADILVVSRDRPLPGGVDLARQKVTDHIWLEHVIDEKGPIDVTKRYSVADKVPKDGRSAASSVAPFHGSNTYNTTAAAKSALATNGEDSSESSLDASDSEDDKGSQHQKPRATVKYVAPVSGLQARTKVAAASKKVSTPTSKGTSKPVRGPTTEAHEPVSNKMNKSVLIDEEESEDDSSSSHVAIKALPASPSKNEKKRRKESEEDAEDVMHEDLAPTPAKRKISSANGTPKSVNKRRPIPTGPNTESDMDVDEIVPPAKRSSKKSSSSSAPPAPPAVEDSSSSVDMDISGEFTGPTPSKRSSAAAKRTKATGSVDKSKTVGAGVRKRTNNASVENDVSTIHKDATEHEVPGESDSEWEKAAIAEVVEGGAQMKRALTPKRRRGSGDDGGAGDDTATGAARGRRKALVPAEPRVPRAPRVKYEAPIKTHRLYLSQIDRERKNKLNYEIEKLAVENGVSICWVDNIGEATVFVSYGNHAPGKSQHASINLLWAIMRGIWIVEPAWLESLLKHGGRIPKYEKYEITTIPGPRASRLARAARRAYLEENGLTKQEADDDKDPHLPRLLFSDWTFNLDLWKENPNPEELMRIIEYGAGKIGARNEADIWFSSRKGEIVEPNYAPSEPMSEEDARNLEEHPTLRKRAFEGARTKRRMPTFAFDTLDWLRDSIINYEPQDHTNAKKYPNRLRFFNAF